MTVIAKVTYLMGIM